MTDLSGKWIEVFKVGDYGEKGKFTTAELDKIAESYNPKLHEAPVVIGHPAHDQPAYGLVKAVRRAGNSLWAQLSKVDPGFSNLVEQGRFTKRSVALYRNMPQTGGPYLRHLGFLGAMPPAVKGLQPIQFNDGERGEHVSIEFKEETLINPNPEDTKRTIREAVQEFFAELFGKKTDPAGASFTEAQVKDRIDAAAQKLETAFQEKLDGLDKKFKEGATAADGEKARLKVAAFVERLRAAHRWLPAFDKAGLPAVLAHLAGSDATVSFGEGDKKKDVKLYDALTTFLESLPELIPSGELAAGKPGRGKVVQFTEPQNPASVDSDSLALAERAEALEADIRKENPKFSETEVARLALQRARQEQSAGSVAAGKV